MSVTEANNILSERNSHHSKYEDFDETGLAQPVQENIVSECLQSVLALKSDLENVEKSSNSDNIKTGSGTPVNFKATGEYQKQEMDTGAEEDKTCRNNDMNVSHTESGYLTDSHISKECDSVHDRHDSNNSENDRTPCGENLMTFSSSSSNTSIKEILNDCSVAKSIADCSHVIGNNQTPVSQLEKTDEGLAHFANMDTLNELENSPSFDDIFTSNLQTQRPDTLLLDNENKNCDRYWSTNDIVHNAITSQSEDLSSFVIKDRKRSKSSEYPKHFQTEVVDESEVVLSQSLPHGQIIGSKMGMIEFIADDIQEKIRSSSVSKTVSSDLSSRHSSILSLTSIDSIVSSSMATSMTSGMSRSFPQSPDCMPPIDPSAIHDIESQARLVADGLDHLMGNLRNNLYRMLAISVGCDEAYRTSVDITCDSMDTSIKSMMTLIAKCEELSNTMEPVYKLADQIKEIKRLLDRFENQLLEKQP